MMCVKGVAMIGRLVTVGLGLAAAGLAVGVAVGSSLRPKVRKPVYEVKPGDMVQWQSQGVFIFPQPRKVTQVQEYKDGSYVFVEDERTGFPLEQIVVVRQAEDSDPT
jgi:hypothetical protein